MRRLELGAAWLSVAAASLHLLAGPAHLEEWWAYGLFFFGAAAVQAIYALLLFTRGVEGWGGWAAVRGKVYLLGIAVTMAMILVWAVSRTVGVPVGPEAFEPEPVEGLDTLSKAVEGTLLIVLARLWWLSERPGAGVAAPARPPGASRGQR